MFASSNDDVGIGIIYAIGCGISSLLFFTASEVVEILHDMRRKMYEKNRT